MCILVVIAMSSIALAAEDPVQPNAPRNNVSPGPRPQPAREAGGPHRAWVPTCLSGTPGMGQRPCLEQEIKGQHLPGQRKAVRLSPGTKPK